MDAIRQWFLDHNDGELIVAPRGFPYSMIPPTSKSQPILYSTKPSTMLGVLDAAENTQLGFVGHNGLPHESEFELLRASLQGHTLLYLGDADPCDLLIFAWLRTRCVASFCGLSDSLLARCGVVIDERITIPMNQSEVDSMPFLAECLPEFERLIGPQCSALLNSGRKMELEALINYSKFEADALVWALVP